MKKLTASSTSVLVTAGLVIYLESVPISANNPTRNLEIQKLEQLQFWQKAKRKLFKDRFSSKCRLSR